jgi:hypothetical protein
MNYIEIETSENSRLVSWVRIYGSTSANDAVEWGEKLLSGFRPNDPTQPRLRITDRHGVVTGTFFVD